MNERHKKISNQTKTLTVMEQQVQPPPPPTVELPPTIRFLGFLTQPDAESEFELQESDVIWSPNLSDSSNSPRVSSLSNSPNSVTSTTTTQTRSLSHHSFRSEKLFGLSAALSEDQTRPFVNRKPLNSSFSMLIPPPRSRSSSSSGDYSSFYQSAPVDVPNWGKGDSVGERRLGFFNEVEEREVEEEEMLPPHEIVVRLHSTAFSVFEGLGRTLKGRDMRSVRNAVFQKTGFLD